MEPDRLAHPPQACRGRRRCPTTPRLRCSWSPTIRRTSPVPPSAPPTAAPCHASGCGSKKTSTPSRWPDSPDPAGTKLTGGMSMTTAEKTPADLSRRAGRRLRRLRPELATPVDVMQERVAELAAKGPIVYFTGARRSLGRHPLRGDPADPDRHGDVLQLPEQPGQHADIGKFIPLELDPPEHTAYRHALRPLFSPQRMKRLSDNIRVGGQRADRRASPPTGEAELISAFAHELPARVFLALMDWPLDGRAVVHRSDRRHAVRQAGRHRGGVQPGAGAGRYEDRRLLPEDGGRPARQPGDDVTSTLIHTEVELPDGTRLLNDEELNRMFFLLAMGGLHTVQGSLAWAIVHLCQQPRATRPDHRRPGSDPEGRRGDPAHRGGGHPRPARHPRRRARWRQHRQGRPADPDAVLGQPRSRGVPRTQRFRPRPRVAIRTCRSASGRTAVSASTSLALSSTIAMEELHRRIPDYQLWSRIRRSSTPARSVAACACRSPSPREEVSPMTTSLPRQDRIRRALELLRNETTDKFDDVVGFSASEFTDPVLAQQERDLIFGRVPSIVAHGSEIARPVRLHDGADAAQQHHRRAPEGRWRQGVRQPVPAPRRAAGGGREGPLPLLLLPVPPLVLQPRRLAADGDPRRHLRGNRSQGTRPDRAAVRGAARLHLGGRQRARRRSTWRTGWAPRWMRSSPGTTSTSWSVSRSAGFDEPTNWKIMQDAFLDGYHIQYAHPNTAGKIIHTNVMAFEDFGRHCRFIAPRKSIDRWLEEDPGDRDLRSPRHRNAFPAAQQHAAAPAGSLPAADLPAAPQRPDAVPDGAAADGAAAGEVRHGRGALE